ncbi:MAG: hypothetical protein C5B47_05095 [Verrucomicrobia bacterium]|nr:MAG: hypothetical protein C5B47_05095 [Verrucomicrobiota bacterium]
MAETTIQVVYVTSSEFKSKENRIFADKYVLADGTAVRDKFRFEIRPVPIKEILEVRIEAMVMEEVTKAYSQLKVPCIVEHAGLVFDGYEAESYPGGLTKPMWNALKGRFVQETQSAGRAATARAVVAYCDGKSVITFIGETKGTIIQFPRGKTQFYWDTVFVPEDPNGKTRTKTYAEIVDDPDLGIEYKVLNLSQSSKAMEKFLNYRLLNPPEFWPRC